MEEEKKGFSYTVSRVQIDEYMNWPVERRLEWLFYGNTLRKELPEKTGELHDALREGRVEKPGSDLWR